MTDLIETVTTVPLVRPDATGEERYPFWEAVLTEPTGNHPHLAVERRADPLWAVVLVLIGAFASVCAGAFFITIGIGS